MTTAIPPELRRLPTLLAFLIGLLLVVSGLLLGAMSVAADVGPKPSVDVAVRWNGGPVPNETCYAQMLTCYTERKSNGCIGIKATDCHCERSEALSLCGAEIASSQKTLLAMTQCTEFISAQYMWG